MTAAPRYTPEYPLFGIVNGHGSFWTHEVFRTEAAAHRHMIHHWGDSNSIPAGHKIIPVRVWIEDARK